MYHFRSSKLIGCVCWFLLCVGESLGLSKLASLRSRRRQYPREDPYSTPTSTSEPSATPIPSVSSSNSLLPSSNLRPPVEVDTMACRDRTAEFSSVVRSLQSYHVSHTHAHAHTYIYTHTHTLTHTHTNTYTHTQAHTNVLVCTYSLTHAYAHNEGDLLYIAADTLLQSQIIMFQPRHVAC